MLSAREHGHADGRARSPGERKDHHTKQYKTPKEVAFALATAGHNKAQLPILQTLGHAVAAGAYVAAGGLASLTMSDGSRLVFALLFPVGLVAVVLTGAELFTGNTMYMVVAALQRAQVNKGVGRRRTSAGHRRGKVEGKDASLACDWKRLLVNWLLVYFGNFVGALLVAVFLAQLADVLDDSAVQLLVAIGEKKTGAGFGTAFLRGIGCNWLVNLALWQAAAAEDITGKIAAIWPPIAAFVGIGFEHCVANMFFIPLALMQTDGDVTVAGLFWGNLIPVTLGNIFGGSLTMGLAYYLLYVAKSPRPAAARPGSATLVVSEIEVGNTEVDVHGVRFRRKTLSADDTVELPVAAYSSGASDEETMGHTVESWSTTSSDETRERPASVHDQQGRSFFDRWPLV